MKYHQQPFIHPHSTRAQRILSHGSFAFKAALYCVLPYSGLSTSKTAEEALRFYQSNAINLLDLKLEIAQKNPWSPLYRLIAAAVRQHAALDYALSHEFKRKGWYARSARRTYGNLAILFFGFGYLFRSHSLFEITFTYFEKLFTSHL